jgi:hypothetical protein
MLRQFIPLIVLVLLLEPFTVMAATPPISASGASPRSGSASDLMIAPSGRFLPRTLAQHFGDLIDIQDYAPAGGPGVCTGHAEVDTAAMDAAIAAIPATGGTIVLHRCTPNDGGGLRLTHTALFSGKSIKLAGDFYGASSWITCEMSSGPCLEFENQDGAHQQQFEMDNLYISAGFGGGPVSHAIFVSVGPIKAGMWPTFSAHHIFVHQSGESRAPYPFTFRNVLALEPTRLVDRQYSFWQVTLEDFNAFGTRVGGAPWAGQIGIQFGRTIGLFVNGGQVNGFDTCVQQTEYSEGIYFDHFTAVSCNTDVGQVEFPPRTNNVRLLGFNSVGGTWTANTADWVLDDVVTGTSLGDSFGASTGHNGTIIALTDSVSVDISDASFNGAGRGHGTIAVHLLHGMQNSNRNIIHDSVFANVDTAVKIDRGSAQNYVHDNSAGNQLVDYVDNGTGDTVEYPFRGAPVFQTLPLSPRGLPNCALWDNRGALALTRCP